MHPQLDKHGQDSPWSSHSLTGALKTHPRPNDCCLSVDWQIRPGLTMQLSFTGASQTHTPHQKNLAVAWQIWPGFNMELHIAGAEQLQSLQTNSAVHSQNQPQTHHEAPVDRCWTNATILCVVATWTWDEKHFDCPWHHHPHSHQHMQRASCWWCSTLQSFWLDRNLTFLWMRLWWWGCWQECSSSDVHVVSDF